MHVYLNGDVELFPVQYFLNFYFLNLFKIEYKSYGLMSVL